MVGYGRGKPFPTPNPRQVSLVDQFVDPSVVKFAIYIYTWNLMAVSTLKWLAINWMIPNIYMKNGWTSPNIHKTTGGLGFQVYIYILEIPKK